MGKINIEEIKTTYKDKIQSHKMEPPRDLDEDEEENEEEETYKLTNEITGDIPVILRYIEYESALVWIVYCNDYSLELFKNEIQKYNKWIKTLERGDAPLCSYKYPKDADQLLLSNNIDYNRLFRPEEYSREWDISFDIIGPDNEEYGEYFSNYNQEENKDEIDFESAIMLFDILTRPYDPYNPALGYRILPVTKELFKEQFLYGPESQTYKKAEKEFLNKSKKYE